MKFFWKAFISFFLMVSIAFSVCGTWMVQASFDANYDRELERRLNENDIYRKTLISSVEVYMNNTNSIYNNGIEDAINSFMDIDMKKNMNVVIWSNNKRVIYKSIDNPSEDLISIASNDKNAYMVQMDGNKYNLHVISCVALNSYYSDSLEYYIETITDISSIYKQRGDMIKLYHYIMIVLMIICGLICAFISYMLTRNITLLSKTVRKIAHGDTDVRASISGTDEVAMLARDFNVMADKLNDKMNQIEQHAKNQEAFTSAFAHELKTPLTAIIGYAELLSSMQLDHEDMVKASGYIYSQGRRLESLSYKLMELFFIREQKLEFQNISATYLLQLVYDLVEIGLMNKDIKLVRNFQKGYIYGEKDLLISLFANIIDNARKASSEGSTIYFKGKATSDSYIVTITDTGNGIPKDEIEHLQEAFYMVDKSRSRKEGGAGLGMTLCNEIVKVHGASWKIDSELGKGTTVTITFKNHDDDKE